MIDITKKCFLLWSNKHYSNIGLYNFLCKYIILGIKFKEKWYIKSKYSLKML
jgi:hypothetical protein